MLAEPVPVSVVSELVELSELEDRLKRSADVLLVSLELEVDFELLSLLSIAASCAFAVLDDPTPLMDMDLSFAVTPPVNHQAGNVPV